MESSILFFVTEVQKCEMAHVAGHNVNCRKEGEKLGAFVDAWLGLGILLLGAGIGALLTVVSYMSRIRKLRAEIEAASENKRHAA